MLEESGTAADHSVMLHILSICFWWLCSTTKKQKTLQTNLHKNDGQSGEKDG